MARKWSNLSCNCTNTDSLLYNLIAPKLWLVVNRNMTKGTDLDEECSKPTRPQFYGRKQNSYDHFTKHLTQGTDLDEECSRPLFYGRREQFIWSISRGFCWLGELIDLNGECSRPTRPHFYRREQNSNDLLSFLLVGSVIKLQPCWSTAFKGFSQTLIMVLILKLGTHSACVFCWTAKLQGYKQRNRLSSNWREYVHTDTRMHAYTHNHTRTYTHAHTWWASA